MGEFVFDHAWLMPPSVPGLVLSEDVSCGPVHPSDRRAVSHEAWGDQPALIRLLGQALQSVCKQNELSSVHVNFCLPDEAEALAEIGYLKRVGIQYQWLNHSYHTFDDYLAHFA
jgi:predicted N-acyltransferase